MIASFKNNKEIIETSKISKVSQSLRMTIDLEVTLINEGK